MKVICTFIVVTDKSRCENELAVLFQCEKDKWYLKYTIDDGLGWSEKIEEIDSHEANKLII